ncbi:ribosome biogenesis GTP-binding protein YihA/YsxC [Mycoplasmatota bacterium]|nr:ribosome biogenesis GTP-binding protein YihA/YsxC [Mycoplasmatota bacterium]
MKIKSAEYKLTGVRFDQFPDNNFPEFVMLGRSNVGKSSFINSLLNKKNLAYTSSKPGKTQTLNFFLINKEFYLVDVPGYGYAKVSKKMREEFGKMIENYLLNRTTLKHSFLIVDLRHQPSEDDVLMYEFLKYYQVPTTIIATKADKIGKTHILKHIKLIEKTLNIKRNDNLIIYSSETKQGKDDVLNLLEKLIY